MSGADEPALVQLLPSAIGTARVCAYALAEATNTRPSLLAVAAAEPG